jgi:hypothetical protein
MPRTPIDVRPWNTRTSSQALAQQGEVVAAEQALKPHVGRPAHAGANLRSGSPSRILARPSQLQRETKTASMPSRRCSWQIADPGQLGIAGPLALAGNNEIEIEFADQPHAVCAGSVVDAGEGLVEQHQPRRQCIVALAVEARYCGEQRHG